MMNNDLVQRALALLSQPTERVKPQETLKQQALTQRPDTGSTIEAGSCIVWTRGDGSIQTGVVDYLHVDDTGTRWAFVTQGSSWSAVNVKFAKRMSGGE
jgi:hypothetical protein